MESPVLIRARVTESAANKLHAFSFSYLDWLLVILQDISTHIVYTFFFSLWITSSWKKNNYIVHYFLTLPCTMSTTKVLPPTPPSKWKHATSLQCGQQNRYQTNKLYTFVLKTFHGEEHISQPAVFIRSSSSYRGCTNVQIKQIVPIHLPGCRKPRLKACWRASLTKAITTQSVKAPFYFSPVLDLQHKQV